MDPPKNIYDCARNRILKSGANTSDRSRFRAQLKLNSTTIEYQQTQHILSKKLLKADQNPAEWYGYGSTHNVVDQKLFISDSDP